jgi:hypothetical protein
VEVYNGPSTFYPFGIAYNPNTGYLWVGNVTTLNEYTTAGALVNSISEYSGAHGFGSIDDIKVGPDGTVYVADYDSSQIVVLSWAGSYATTITGISNVTGVAVNSAGTTLYAASSIPSIMMYSINSSTNPKTFTYVGSFTTTASGPGYLEVPGSLAVDSSGNVYVANTSFVYFFGDIIKYGPTGAGPVSFGTAALNNPYGIAVDNAGDILAAQYPSTGFIQEFTGSGSAYTAGVSFGDTDLLETGNLTLDGSGNIYVANDGGHQILEFPRTN